ncbi:MAG: L-rhamnose mutarotase [Bernardetiaceae bacterium]|jgi:L-rhamnose mutarotase|nr:L-rhamnose mutarotase [Bernardetiaceae bacterium]
MKVFAQTLNLKDDPEVIRQYRYHHAHPYPEVVEALRAVGIINLEIFLLGRRLFMYLTTVDAFDPAVDFPRYLARHPRCQAWEDLMTTFQEPVPEAQPGQKWAPMECVFDLQAGGLPA